EHIEGRRMKPARIERRQDIGFDLLLAARRIEKDRCAEGAFPRQFANEIAIDDMGGLGRLGQERNEYVRPPEERVEFGRARIAVNAGNMLARAAPARDLEAE